MSSNKWFSSLQLELKMLGNEPYIGICPMNPYDIDSFFHQHYDCGSVLITVELMDILPSAFYFEQFNIYFSEYVTLLTYDNITIFRIAEKESYP